MTEGAQLYGYLFAFLDAAKEWGLKEVYVHAFMDGRDTDPGAEKDLLKTAQTHGIINRQAGNNSGALLRNGP